MSEGLIVTAGLRPRVHVREFGTPAIVADGREEHPKLTRSVEVLAYLAERGGRATRPELLDDLFDGRADDSARSYLRQALRGLREALPADAPLTVEGDDVLWTDEQLTSDSLQARSDIQQALHLRGRARLDALRSPLEVLERGDFLPEARSRWADRRREELHELATDARLAAAEAAFDLGELELAEEQVQGVLATTPTARARGGCRCGSPRRWATTTASSRASGAARRRWPISPPPRRTRPGACSSSSGADRRSGAADVVAVVHPELRGDRVVQDGVVRCCRPHPHACRCASRHACGPRIPT